MSDQISGYHHKQPWLRHCSGQNVTVPLAYKNNHRFDPFHQPAMINNSAIPPSDRSGAKSYFRFHGGIGDGCGGVAYRNTEHSSATRPLQLFEALNRVDIQIEMRKKESMDGLVKNPVTGPPIPAMEVSGGTGVFLPVYPKKIRSTTKGFCARRGSACGRRMKQEDIPATPSVDRDVVHEKEFKDIDEIPIELLLPSEWTY